MISIVIPTYEQNGVGVEMLQKLFVSIAMQKTSYLFEVCVSDNSKDNNIWELCMRFPLPIKYKQNPIVGNAENFNGAMEMAKYDRIKMMCQDDEFRSPYAINYFVEGLDHHGWCVSNSIHVDANNRIKMYKKARYDHNQFEKNITGMPSVISWRKCDLRFNENLRTFCDMYFYYQLYELYGEPFFINKFTINQRFHDDSYSRRGPKDHDKDRQFLRENNLIKC